MINTMNNNLTYSKKPSELTLSETEIVSGGCPPCVVPVLITGAKLAGGAAVVAFGTAIGTAAGKAAWKKVSELF